MREEVTEAMARYPEVPTPERPRGTPEQQIERLYRYLWQMAETINNIINTLNKEDKSNGEDRN